MAYDTWPWRPGVTEVHVCHLQCSAHVHAWDRKQKAGGTFFTGNVAHAAAVAVLLLLVLLPSRAAGPIC
jgi:hypothetical protein